MPIEAERLAHRRLSMTIGDELCPRDEDIRGGAERRQRFLRVIDELVQARFRALGPKNADHRRLTRGRVLAGLLTDEGGITLNVEKIVGDLKSLADRCAVAIECLALRAARLAEDAAGTAGETE